MKTTTEIKTNPENVTLVYYTSAKSPELHRTGCQAIKPSRKAVVITSDVVANIKDLEEREYTIKVCKCLG